MLADPVPPPERTDAPKAAAAEPAAAAMAASEPAPVVDQPAPVTATVTPAPAPVQPAPRPAFVQFPQTVRPDDPGPKRERGTVPGSAFV